MTILGHDPCKCCCVEAVAAAAKNTKTAETKATNPTIKHKRCTTFIHSSQGNKQECFADDHDHSWSWSQQMLSCRPCCVGGPKYENCRNKGDKPNNRLPLRLELVNKVNQIENKSVSMITFVIGNALDTVLHLPSSTKGSFLWKKQNIGIYISVVPGHICLVLVCPLTANLHTKN